MNTNAGSISYSCAGRFIGVPDPNLRPEDRRAPACKPTRLTILTEPGIEHQTVDYIRGKRCGADDQGTNRRGHRPNHWLLRHDLVEQSASDKQCADTVVARLKTRGAVEPSAFCYLAGSSSRWCSRETCSSINLER